MTSHLEPSKWLNIKERRRLTNRLAYVKFPVQLTFGKKLNKSRGWELRNLSLYDHDVVIKGIGGLLRKGSAVRTMACCKTSRGGEEEEHLPPSVVATISRRYSPQGEHAPHHALYLIQPLDAALPLLTLPFYAHATCKRNSLPSRLELLAFSTTSFPCPYLSIGRTDVVGEFHGPEPELPHTSHYLRTSNNKTAWQHVVKLDTTMVDELEEVRA
ncbi:hypothetical protein J5N97_020357 [Dioscorea zingiberensis]|uniref:Uncharacterized protein n=1 Tax=Dioscorea zingiberensis TaxID=325984 RepID=A0A9D5CGX4_9LILI|nr:hypothetical protein J5N97_020357 [Dioscorea zingiberensis]